MIDEGYTKYRVHWLPSEPLDYPQLRTLCHWRSKLHQAGLIGEYSELGIGFGNLSARLDDGCSFLISGTQTGGLQASSPQQFALVTGVDLTQNSVDCTGPVQASSEAMTHAAVYAADGTVRAVVHAHSSALWQHALSRLPLIPAEVAYGTPEMAAAFAALMTDPESRRHGIVAMAGHDEGLLAVGSTVEEASRRLLDYQTSVSDRVPAK